MQNSPNMLKNVSYLFVLYYLNAPNEKKYEIIQIIILRTTGKMNICFLSVVKNK